MQRPGDACECGSSQDQRASGKTPNQTLQGPAGEWSSQHSKTITLFRIKNSLFSNADCSLKHYTVFKMSVQLAITVKGLL